jgi:hypothetical protein
MTTMFDELFPPCDCGAQEMLERMLATRSLISSAGCTHGPRCAMQSAWRDYHRTYDKQQLWLSKKEHAA